MYATSSQLKEWTFSNSEELERLRTEANQNYVEKLNENPNMEGIELLSVQEEGRVRMYFESKLKRLCGRFQPQLPKNVFGTAMNYLKRIYLHTSVMEPLIEDISHTCLFMACKVEEFNISIVQFVCNLEGDKEERISKVLGNEMVVLEKLKFFLNVHNPYKAAEGFLIDIKTRCPDIGDIGKLRSGIDIFIEKCMLTDVPLLFTPSQIALAAVLSSSTNLGLNIAIDSYVANKLLSSESYELQQKMAAQLQKVKHIVRSSVELTYEQVHTEWLRVNQIHAALYKVQKHACSEDSEKRMNKKARLEQGVLEESSNDYKNEFESD